MQATVNDLINQLPKAAPATIFGPPFDDSLLIRPQPFVGREDEVDWLMTRLAGGTTSAITAVGGIGGIGKTGLVAEVIARAKEGGMFPDGIAVMLCQDRTDALGILRDVLTRFDQERKPPQASNLAGLTDTARILLDGKCVAVVLDNLEPDVHLRDLVPPLQHSGATVLITARQELPIEVIPMSAQRRIDILSPQDASDLFKQVYRAACQHTGRAPSPLLIAFTPRIVGALGYHTYAVRIIAAYAADTRPDLDHLAEQLEQDLTLALGIRNVDASEFLGAVFARSVDALLPEAKALLLALGLVPVTTLGRFATLALGAGCGLSERDADGALTLLARRALVTIGGDGAEEGSDRVRVQLHPLMHAYAQRRAETQWNAEQQAAALDALERFFADYVNDTDDAALAPDESLIHLLIERAHEQDHEDALIALCLGMRAYWRDRSRISAALRYLPWTIAAAQHLMQTTDDAAARLRLANLQVVLGDIYANIGQLTEAEQFYRADLVERRALSDRRMEGAALSRLGQIAQRRGRLAEASDYFQQALVINREVRDRQSEGWALSSLGQIAQLSGRLEEAGDYFQQSLQIRREVQDQRGEGVDLSFLGLIAQSRGQLEEANNYFQQSLRIRREAQDRQGEGVALNRLGLLAQSREQLVEASDYFHQSLVLLREVQDRQYEGIVLYNLATLYEEQKEFGLAEQAYRNSLAIALELGLLPDIAQAQEALAALLMRHTPEQAQSEACQLLVQARANYQSLERTDDAGRVDQRIRELGSEKLS